MYGEVNPRTFFKIGIVCFFIIGVMGIWGFIANYSFNAWYQKVSSLASIIFNFALVGMFWYILNSQPDTEGIPETLNDEDIERMLNNDFTKRGERGYDVYEREEKHDPL